MDITWIQAHSTINQINSVVLAVFIVFLFVNLLCQPLHVTSFVCQWLGVRVKTRFVAIRHISTCFRHRQSATLYCSAAVTMAAMLPPLAGTDRSSWPSSTTGPGTTRLSRQPVTCSSERKHIQTISWCYTDRSDWAFRATWLRRSRRSSTVPRLPRSACVRSQDRATPQGRRHCSYRSL